MNDGDGAASAFDDRYRLLYPEMVRLAFGLVGAAAEDVVQDVFVRVGDRLVDLEAPGAYVRAAVVNECRSWHRQRARRERFAWPEAMAVPPRHLVEFADALAGLPERQRTVLVLRYLADLHDDDIARLLRCRRTTVRSLAARGLARLREVMGDA